MRPAWLFVGSAVSILLYGLLVNRFRLLAAGSSQLGLLAVLVSAILSSIAGFVFSAICAALLLPFMPDPVQVVKILFLGSIAIQSLSVWTSRRAIDWRTLSRFLVGSMLGLLSGIYLLLHLPVAMFVHLLGGFLVVYGGYSLFRSPMILRTKPQYDILVGVVAGITGGFAVFPGAAVTIWCGLIGWDKDRQRGVCQPFILTMQVAALLMLQATTPATIEPGLGTTAWTFVPAALAGACCGLAFFKRLTDCQFATAVKLLLVASGLGLAF